MKLTLFLPPVVALVVTGFLIGGKGEEIGRLEEQSLILSREIQKAKSRPASDRDNPHRKRGHMPGPAKEPINWKEIATMVEEIQDSGSISNLRKVMSFQRRLLEMDKEELVAALDGINSLDLTDAQRTALIGIILDPLASKDPELALIRFSDRVNDGEGMINWRLSEALGKWAEKDGAAATAWLDKQIADGLFISKSLDGKNQSLKVYEGNLFASLLANHQDLAEQRIAAISTDERREVLSLGSRQLKEENQAAFAEIVRKQLDEEHAIEILAEKASDIAMISELENVDGYMGRISATKAERQRIAEMAANSFIQGKSFEGKVIARDIDEMRDWLGKQSPESVGKTTGATLGELAGDDDAMGFDESSALALSYHKESGDDDLLVSFFENASLDKNKEAASALAAKISDPEKRKKALEGIE